MRDKKLTDGDMFNVLECPTPIILHIISMNERSIAEYFVYLINGQYYVVSVWRMRTISVIELLFIILLILYSPKAVYRIKGMREMA